MNTHPLVSHLPLALQIASKHGCTARVIRLAGVPTMIEIVGRQGVVQVAGHDLVITLDDDIPKHRDELGEWVDLDDGDELDLTLREIRR